RIAAPPGALSALSVIIQVQASAEVVLTVPKTAFYPQPKVDSAVLLLERHAEPPVPSDRMRQFEELVHAAFKQPRKLVGNSLANGLGITKPEAVEILKQAGIGPNVRPQDVAIQDWVRLFEMR
ncbi:MAG TPA: rRNA adenine N-6-methyltransferase family protein, partial [Chloroflexota bacterium]|nr:rRNA adenine N-6-methyltransferase family protein [Chloroflexota bacterium]